MGRSLTFYAVPEIIQHDNNKKICMELDYERTSEEAQECLHEFLYKNKEYLSFYEKEEAKRRTWNENPIYLYENYSSKLTDDWCPWCAVFAAQGFFDSPLVKGSIIFDHPYSNPIWKSDWHFYNMYPGKNHTDFINRFDSDRMYRQVFLRDIKNMHDTIEVLGTAYRTVDKEALEETLRAISFCKKCLEEPNTCVIYHSEL